LKLTNVEIKDLITPDAKLTFLVGAGCSMDSPSCLPAGRAMMDAIIDYTCVESEIDKIKGLNELRFEQLIEMVRDSLDPELKIIDFYGSCDKPNTQHFFLAEMMKQGQFVLTTNFDFLIEYALQQSGVSKEQIVPVITRDDFETFQDPYGLFEQGKKALYKIHGSTKNVITEEDTRKSLVATIQAFGSNKEGENVFQLESFKQPAFRILTKDRSIVVIGYSGSDDFDIVPTLEVLSIPNIIWINHSNDIEIGNEEIHKIDVISSETIDELDIKLKQLKKAAHVYRVDINTSEMVKQLLQFKPKLSSEDFSFKSRNWLENNLDAPSEITKYAIPYRIYADFDMYDDALRCCEEIFQLAKKTEDKSSEASALNIFALIYRSQGNYPEALKRLEDALQIAEQLGDLREKATYLNNIGMVYYEQGNYPDALKRYEKALQIEEQLGDLRAKATYLNNIGMIYYAQENYPEALKRYEKALQIYEQLGDLRGKATCLSNIGEVFRRQENYPKALKRYKQALQIAEQLGNLNKKSTFLNNIGLIYYDDQKNYPEALKWYEEALKIAEQLGDLRGEANCLNNIGLVYYAQKNYPEALKRYKEALQIADQLGDLSGKANSLENIGLLYLTQGIYPKALKHYKAVLNIFNKLGLSEAPYTKAIKEFIEMITGWIV